MECIADWEEDILGDGVERITARYVDVEELDRIMRHE